MNGIVNWIWESLGGSRWLWRIVSFLMLLPLLGTAPLNWSAEKMTGAQVTTAQTSRTSTSPSNAVLLATGSATAPMRITGIRWQTTAAITAQTAIFLFLSNDGGTTKYYHSELTIPIQDISAQFKKPAGAVWNFDYIPLNGTNDKLYATVYTTDTINLFPLQITY